MFFHTHVYYAEKVDKNLDALKVIGSIIPDLAGTSIITWDNLHKKKDILNFSSYVKKSHPAFTSLLKGINYHNSVDYLSHVKYKNSTPGYAYASATPQLIDLTQKAYNVSPERAKISAHNNIECGVDYHLLNDHPQLAELIKNSIKEIDMAGLSKLIAEYFKKSEKETFKALKIFFSIATDYDLRSIDEWVRLFVGLNKMYLKTDSNEELTRKVLELSFKITKDTYKEFIQTAIATKDTEIKDCN
ncbi:MAG: hypothetical protein HY426_02605 [Candidatus Levybacteria bacterium]|nr:hypothetical protein [Candidatus Levybacteria bacterium]